MSHLQEYLDKTGQTMSDVMEGAATFGPAFIEDELIPKALAENKKIIWIPEETDGEDLGRVSYELQDI